ncbi:NYN domain-containing protein [Candidatus Peregrinibacteria bacterium]|nr:MAG: NYN domain-containing protein [Candidatus Peregrinibacteria bacterium]
MLEIMENKSRIAVFVDAGNLWSSYKKLGKTLALEKLPDFFAQQFSGDIFRVFYYVAYPAEGTRPKAELDGHHRFLTFLKKGLNFEIVKKPLKTIHLRNPDGKLIVDQRTGKPQSMEKGNFHVELTIDAMKYVDEYDIAILMTGDSDFLSLITHLRTLIRPKQVYIFSTEGNISQELRTGGDGYFDLASYPEIHGTPLGFRKDKK